MTGFSLELPEGITTVAAAQAERAGISLDQYLMSIIASRLGAQAEAERYFAARAARAVPGRAREILSRAGIGRPPEPGDELPPDLAEQLAAPKAQPEY